MLLPQTEAWWRNWMPGEFRVSLGGPVYLKLRDIVTGFAKFRHLALIQSVALQQIHQK